MYRDFVDRAHLQPYTLLAIKYWAFKHLRVRGLSHDPFHYQYFVIEMSFIDTEVDGSLPKPNNAVYV